MFGFSMKFGFSYHKITLRKTNLPGLLGFIMKITLKTSFHDI